MMNMQDYIDDFENIDLDESEFDSIDQSFNELEKMNIKKNMRERIKMEKKNKRILKVVAIPAIVAITVGVTSIPAVAENIPFISGIYEKLGFGDKYLECTKYIGKTIEHDGIKVTINDITGSKYKVAVTAKVDMGNFDEDKLRDVTIGCDFNGDGSWGGSAREFKGENGENLIYAELDNLAGNEEKGDLTIIVRFPDGNEEKLTCPIDFSKAFKQVKEVNIDRRIDEAGLNINKIKLDVFGCEVLATNDAAKGPNYNNSMNSKVVLKAGDNFYQMNYFGGNGDNNIFDLSKEAYTKVESEKEFRIIPITFDVTNEELEEVYNEYKNNNGDKLSENNVRYDKEFKFSNGSKVEINKIERVDDKVKIYYKASSEKEAILMGTGMVLENRIENPEDPNSYANYKMYNGYFYNDTDDIYVAEFDEVDADKGLELSFGVQERFIDKVEIMEGIKIDK